MDTVDLVKTDVTHEKNMIKWVKNMLSVFNTLKGKKGNVTVMWALSLPMFVLIVLFVTSMAMGWIAKSTSQMAADAGSVAATKKIDEVIQIYFSKEAQKLSEQGKTIDFSDQRLLSRVFQNVSNHHKEEIAESVRKYAKKNGGSSHGYIKFPVEGRVQVIAYTKYEPMAWEEYFKKDHVRGTGLGPTRHFFKSFKGEPLVIQY